MTLNNKTIKEIKDQENLSLSIYPALPAHTPEADEKTIKKNLRLVDFLQKLGLIKNHAKVIDIGCGTGWLVEMFRRKGYDAYGGDILPIQVMEKRYPHSKFLFFDIFSPPPPRNLQKYDFAFIRALGPVEKIPDWQDLALFPWISNHLNDGGILYFAHNSNGSGIANEMRCNQSELDIVKVLEKTIGTVLYCNRLPKNMTFVVQKGAAKKLNDQAIHSTGYILNLWKGPQRNIFYWLVHGMPVLFMPSDDLAILNIDRKQWNIVDYILILRTYPVRTIRNIVKLILKN